MAAPKKKSTRVDAADGAEAPEGAPVEGARADGDAPAQEEPSGSGTVGAAPVTDAPPLTASNPPAPAQKGTAPMADTAAAKDSGPALKPRKVLHIDTSTTWRGPQTQLLLLVKGMEARGWPVHVACPIESPLWEAVEFLGDRRITIPSDLSERTAASVFRAQPDLVAAHTLSGYASVAQLPLPLAIHRTIADFPPGAWMERRPEGFVVASDMVSRALRRMGIRNVAVVREGVEALPDASGPALDAPAVLMADTPPGHPDNDVITTAAEKLGEVDFAVLGRGPNIYKGIRWLGQRADLSNLLDGAQVFIQLSLQDGLASSVIQAMLAGLPVIVSDAEGLPDVVGDSGIVVPQGDAKALITAIKQVLAGGHPNLTAARARAVERYSVDGMVTRSLETYSAIIGASAYRWGNRG